MQITISIILVHTVHTKMMRTCTYLTNTAYGATAQLITEAYVQNLQLRRMLSQQNQASICHRRISQQDCTKCFSGNVETLKMGQKQQQDHYSGFQVG